MAIFEFRRHSIKDGDPKGTCGPKGIAFAKAVGSQLMLGKEFTHYCVSTFPRTQQTLAAMAEGARWQDVNSRTSMPPIYLDWASLQEVWRICHEAEKRGEDMMRAAALYDQALITAASKVIANLFESWVLQLPDDAQVLIIGHSPHMEMLVYGITDNVIPGMVIPGLKECQGFRVRTSVGSAGVISVVEHQAPDLNPAELRAMMFGDE
jgi:broad specificity phosphatase PhoE